MRVHRPLVDQVLQERAEQLEPVPLLHLLDERVDRQQRAHREDEVVDELVGGLGVQQGAHDLWGLPRGDLLDCGGGVVGGGVWGRRGPRV
jgi:hypothetical protein